jgi:hypothetical protein
MLSGYDTKRTVYITVYWYWGITHYRMSLFLYRMNRGEQLHVTFQHRGPVWSSGSDH